MVFKNAKELLVISLGYLGLPFLQGISTYLTIRQGKTLIFSDIRETINKGRCPFNDAIKCYIWITGN